MDYYERKAQTIQIIDGMIEKGYFNLEDLQYAVLKNTGMGAKFVTDYVNTGVLRGLFFKNREKGFSKMNKKQEIISKKEDDQEEA
jgi:hypothetical protein